MVALSYLLTPLRQSTPKQLGWRGTSTPKLGGQGLATLVATCGNDGTAGAGAHAGTETVHACTTTVVGLESTLALGHGTSLLNFR